MTCSAVQLNLHRASPCFSRNQMDIKAEMDWASGSYISYSSVSGQPGHPDYTALYAYGVPGPQQPPGMMPLSLDGAGFESVPYHSAYMDYHAYPTGHHVPRGDALFPASYLPTAGHKQDLLMPRRLEQELNLFKMEKRPCDVCGDVAAGFHCGAYVCEACKKFFIRSSRAELQGSSKYSCTKNGNCDVSKETRTHCQYCRFKKCIDLNMFPPGKNPSMGAPISEIPCRVCGAPSSGFHFGAITCEGCKGFFRRTIKERDSGKYICSKGSRCDINQQTRNACKSCRFSKCLHAGMSSEGSRIGRQPNAVKHMCAQEIQDLKTKRQRVDPHSSHMTSCDAATTPSSYVPGNQASLDQSYAAQLYSSMQSQQQELLNLPVGHSASPTSSPGQFNDPAVAVSLEAAQVLGNSSSSRLSGCSDSLSDGDRADFKLDTAFFDTEVAFDKMGQYCQAVYAAIVELEGLKHRPTPYMMKGVLPQDIWSINYLIKHFHWLAQSVLKFANRIPFFSDLPGDVPSLLLCEAFYPIVLLSMARDYDVMNRDSTRNNLLRLEPSEFRQVCQYYPQLLNTISEHMHSLGCQFAAANFDNREFSLMLALRLFRIDPQGQSKFSTDVATYKRHLTEQQQKVLLCLKSYQSDKYQGNLATFDWIQHLQNPLDTMNMEFSSRLRELGFPLTELFQVSNMSC